ncbi:ribonuclease H-like domain-containing protein [candidate division KSB1 bacterium]|nr:ribonuclease H-like domain-containing protein [candidate division KSB1 bacterium]
MNLKEKLYQLNLNKTHSAAPEPIKIGSGIENYVEGCFVETPVGACFMTRAVLTENDMNHHDIFRLPQKSAKFFPVVGKDWNLKTLDINQTVFLDTETTGLAGGAGTYVILVGLGYFSTKGFEIEQYFLENYQQEPALLHCLEERLKDKQAIISYNGKSYDIPLLKTRFTLAKIDTNFFPTLHLDLLYTARRFWKKLLESCSLASVEENILNIHRQHDLPGSQVPQLYFDYLRTGDAAPLKSIFEHNFQDVLSLAYLTLKSYELFEYADSNSLSAPEYFNIAAIYENLDLLDESIRFYERAWEKNLQKKGLEVIGLQLGSCYKRVNRWEKAVELWQQMLSKGISSYEVLLELAKYYEHQVKDYAKAISYTRTALNDIDFKEMVQPAAISTERREALLYRYRRLKRKIEGGQPTLSD